MLENNFLTLSSSTSYTTFKHKKFNVCALTKPSGKFSGDFYDIFLIDENNLALVIVDVAGKGKGAYEFYKLTKMLIKKNFQLSHLPSKVLETVNIELFKDNDSATFATAFVGVINIVSGEFIFSSAGHNDPVIYRNFEHKYSFLELQHALVLGVKHRIDYIDEKIFLQKGDIVFLYTDGIVEAMDEKNNLFSKERLCSNLNVFKRKNYTVKETLLKLQKKVTDFTGKNAKTDDITMIAFEKIN